MFILTLEQIIVLNKCCPYNKPVPKISHVKHYRIFVNEIQITRKCENKITNLSFYFSNIDCEAIRAVITLKLGRLLSFMIRNAFLSINLHVVKSR